MYRRLTPWGDSARVRTAPARESVDAADVAWILLLPGVAIAALAIALLAPIGGRLLLPDPHYSYWTGPGLRKSAVDVGYGLFVIAVAAYAGAIVRCSGLRMSPAVRRVLVAIAQAAMVAFLVVGLVAQSRQTVFGTTRAYFTPVTLAFAAVVGAFALSRHRKSSDDVRRLPRWTWTDGRAVQIACFGVAVLATVIFVLPAVHTDSSTPSGEAYLGALFYDEATAVLNGRSTLVEMVAYGNLWPYLTLFPLRVFGDTYATYTVTMASLTALALLALYGVLWRVVARPLPALALYLPVLATGFFLEHRIDGDRYDPGTYFGMFPLRYAGPICWRG